MPTRDDADTITVTGGRRVTRELAEWVAGLRYEDLPAAVVDEAGRAFADFLGECLFVGATKPWHKSFPQGALWQLFAKAAAESGWRLSEEGP